MEFRVCEFIEKRGLVVSVVLTFVMFILFYFVISPVQLNNMGGEHSWLSGSTIKFVNNWLEEGAANLNFTNYEYPKSIEFGDGVEKRVPYLSYPTGETFTIYSIARVIGKQEITVGFLHKLQMIFFVIEAMLLSSFVYLFSKRTLKLKKPAARIILATSTSILWFLLPTCAYYLPNVFFADQLIILWAMIFVLVEYLYKTALKKKTIRVLEILRAFVIFTGVLIDYYFWVLVAVAFVFELVRQIMLNKKTHRVKKILGVVAWYGMPAMLGVIAFIWQLSATNGWLGYMVGIFFFRTAGDEKYNFTWIMDTLKMNFSNAFLLDARMVWYLVLFVLLVVCFGAWYVWKSKKVKQLFLNAGFSVILVNILAIILQLALLKQHSAIHEFSMIKVAWFIALMPLCGTIVYMRIFRKKLSKISLLQVYAPCFIIIVLVTGVPVSTQNFINSRLALVEYPLESIIAQNFQYEDVLFSFTEEIKMNPPQSLAISKKPIWKIEEVAEIDSRFPELSQEARKVLIIEKTEELPEGARKKQECLVKNGEKRYEDDHYLFINLKNILNCKEQR